MYVVMLKKVLKIGFCKKNEACLIGRGRGEGGFNLRLMTVRDRHQPLRDVWCTVSSRNLAS